MPNTSNMPFSPSVLFSIEKDINAEIGKCITTPPDNTLESMKNDIPRLAYCIEGIRANDFNTLIKISSASQNTIWIKDNITGLAFIHQGLYQVIMDHSKIKYKNHDVLCVGLDVRNSFVLFNFYTKNQKHYISISAGGKISALVTKGDTLLAMRDKSNISFSLTMEFIPFKKTFFGTQRPKVRVLTQPKDYTYELTFTESFE
ncbi:hypothetical protein F3J28_03530 [Enterobacter sp. Ap-1006]|uniref:hypothetical protein n=1 Tax=Enterobacter sp. Ap-1006 TaxID=2608345 RepID=UPI001422FD4D|nr:hypothetical protein [Enterobacter sp. Ap-1006]NIF46838.1 hypothetical protein [Enterobacter sp. Ap-1006]